MLAVLIDERRSCAGYAYSKQISLSDLLLNTVMLLEWVARSFIAKGESISALRTTSTPSFMAVPDSIDGCAGCKHASSFLLR